MHSVASPVQVSSEYVEVTPAMLPKNINQPLSPEPYATVTLRRGGTQSDDSCVKCSASPSSSEYNAPVREPMNLCDLQLPPPPDQPYASYKPLNNNMTIRTNPAAISPHIGRRVPPTPSQWEANSMPPPIPNFPQNWGSKGSKQNINPNSNSQGYYPEENDYESGSVIYEQCCRPEDANFFNRGGEPTEEYYRNINMEFLDDREMEPSMTPPPPCPDTYNNTNISISSSSSRNTANKYGYNCLYAQDPHHPHQQQQHHIHHQQPQQPQHQQQQQTARDNSPINMRRTLRSQNSNADNRSTQSSDESESDNNRWVAPRQRRSRSKSSDRKYRNGNSIR